jgi:hypothetical protein
MCSLQHPVYFITEVLIGAKTHFPQVQKLDSRLEGGGVNRAKLNFTNINTTTSRVSVRNKNRVRERGWKTNRKQMKSVTHRFVLPRFGSLKPTPR